MHRQARSRAVPLLASLREVCSAVALVDTQHCRSWFALLCLEVGWVPLALPVLLRPCDDLAIDSEHNQLAVMALARKLLANLPKLLDCKALAARTLAEPVLLCPDGMTGGWYRAEAACSTYNFDLRFQLLVNFVQFLSSKA
jgi:hypothetical protein